MKSKKTRYILMAFMFFLIFQARANSARVNNFNWFWFFYETGFEYNKNYTLYRPFYLKNHNIIKNRSYTASVPPLLFQKYESPRNVTRNWFFGFARDDDYLHSNGVKDYDLGVFPLFYYGSSIDKRDRYLMLWPIGGGVRGKFGQEYINAWVFPGVSLFFLFPPSGIIMTGLYGFLSFVPIYSNYGRKGYDAHSILWPLIRWGEGAGKSKFRIMPFYSHSSNKGFYDSYSFLTFINYRKIYFGNKTMSVFFTVPFYGRRWTNDTNASGSTLFWPFFSWGYNKRRGDFEINFPWIIFQYQRSEDPYIRKFILFPLYGKYQFHNKTMKFVTPFYFSLTKDSVNYKHEYRVISFLFWYFKREYKREPSPYYGKSWRYYKLWPVFKYEYNDMGDMSFKVLSIFPFRDPEGYERMYDPFFTLFEYSRNRYGEKKLGILLRTYFQYWGKDFMKIKLFPVLNYSSYNNKVSEFTLLLSAFGYENNRDGKYIKFFWIPIRIGEGRKDKHPGNRSVAREEEKEEYFYWPDYKEEYTENSYATLVSYNF